LKPCVVLRNHDRCIGENRMEGNKGITPPLVSKVSQLSGFFQHEVERHQKDIASEIGTAVRTKQTESSDQPYRRSQTHRETRDHYFISDLKA